MKSKKTTTTQKSTAIKRAKTTTKRADAEASAETVAREEIFSSEERAKKRKRGCGCGHDCDCPSKPKDQKVSKAVKNAGKEKAQSKTSKSSTRPTQKQSKMITHNDACDCGKS